MNFKQIIRFLLGIALAFWSGLSQVGYGLEPGWGSAAVDTRSKSQVLLQGKLNSIDSKIQQALRYYSEGRYSDAVAIWEGMTGKPTNLSLAQLAQLHSNLGAAYRQLGVIGSAITHWQKAVEYYQQIAGSDAAIRRARVLVDLASAYNANGQGKLSEPILVSAIEIAQKGGDRLLEAAALEVLGNVQFKLGELDKAVDTLQASSKLATETGDLRTQVVALNSMGKVLTNRAKRYTMMSATASNEGDLDQLSIYKIKAQQDTILAIDTLNKVEKLSKSLGNIWQINSTINLLSTLKNNPNQQTDVSSVSLDSVFPLLEKLPDSRSKAYALINSTFVDTNPARQINSLEQAIAVTRNTGDLATESYALGILGHTYELNGQYNAALDKTRSAILVSQQVNAQDSLYRWQWQAGRIYLSLGNNQQALTSYKQAIATLQDMRGDIVAANIDLQFDVRDEVEPIYRQLIDIELSNNPTQAGIKDALSTLDLLKLSELQSYFGDDCVQIRSVADNSSPQLSSTVVISSIILKDKAYIILRFPDGVLKSYPIAISAQELEASILEFRSVLEDVATNDYFNLSQKLYDLLIRPIEPDLASAAPQNLVFVNDGLLRNIPMSALYDGKQFLVEKFAIASSAGFDLVAHKPSQQARRALVFGLTVKVPPFPALTGVATEAQYVQKAVGGKVFLDSEFTLANLLYQVQTQGYPFVHLATHGKFGASVETTFLQAFDTRVNLNEFEKILSGLKQPIDLLILSACQTAAGDNRSTLGLAGVAVRNNVENVLATLWFINDVDTIALIEDFYSYLNQPAASPVTALRKAQMKRIANGDHPALWASFVLLGNSF